MFLESLAHWLWVLDEQLIHGSTRLVKSIVKDGISVARLVFAGIVIQFLVYLIVKSGAYGAELFAFIKASLKLVKVIVDAIINVLGDIISAISDLGVDVSWAAKPINFIFTILIEFIGALEELHNVDHTCESFNSPVTMTLIFTRIVGNEVVCPLLRYNWPTWLGYYGLYLLNALSFNPEPVLEYNCQVPEHSIVCAIAKLGPYILHWVVPAVILYIVASDYEGAIRQLILLVENWLIFFNCTLKWISHKIHHRPTTTFRNILLIPFSVENV